MTHKYQVSGITCESCVAKVKTALEKIPDVAAVAVGLDGKVALRMPSASISRQRSCRVLLGSSSLPWRITCGSIGRWPQAIEGSGQPCSEAMIGLAARTPVSYMSTCG